MATQRILVVDDQHDVRRLLTNGIRTLKADLDVAEVPSGEEALLDIARRPVDLLVVDVRLPGMSGFDLIGRVKRRSPNVKVIMVTGIDDAKIRRQVADSSADAFFFKPVHMADFLGAIERCLGIESSPTPPPGVRNPTTPIPDAYPSSRTSTSVRNPTTPIPDAYPPSRTGQPAVRNPTTPMPDSTPPARQTPLPGVRNPTVPVPDTARTTQPAVRNPTVPVPDTTRTTQPAVRNPTTPAPDNVPPARPTPPPAVRNPTVPAPDITRTTQPATRTPTTPTPPPATPPAAPPADRPLTRREQMRIGRSAYAPPPSDPFREAVPAEFFPGISAPPTAPSVSTPAPAPASVTPTPAEVVADLRRSLGAVAVFLIDIIGQVEAQAGDWPEELPDLITQVISALAASTKLSHMLNARKPDGLWYLKGGLYNFCMVHLGKSHALLLVSKAPITPDHFRSIDGAISQIDLDVEALAFAPEELSEVTMSESLLPLGEAASQAAPAEPLPNLDDLFAQMDRVKNQDLDSFWDNVADKGKLEDVFTAKTLTFDQAIKLGLAPGTDEKK